MKYMKRIDGCPGSRILELGNDEEKTENTGSMGSQLRQWPIQLHLVSPMAPYYQGADVLIVADCVAYAIGGFHSEHLKGKAIGIACPKLDSNQESYVEKISMMIALFLFGFIQETKTIVYCRKQYLVLAEFSC